VEALLDLARAAAPSANLTLSGVRAVRAGRRIVLSPGESAGRADKKSVNHFCYPLSIPGEVSVAEAGLAVSARLASEPGLDDGDSGTVEVAGVLPPLIVRNRQPGDRLRPAGSVGRRKLQDLFVDRKVLRGDRDTVPIVVDGRDRIVWVVGHAVAEEFRVTGPREGVILLKSRRLGGAV
jgi:tRNA(Ile)-lysidine synthase